MIRTELDTIVYPNGTWKAYTYSPSFEAAILFVALFGRATIYQLYQLLKAVSCSNVKIDKFIVWIIIPFIIGGLLETFGYTARVILSFDVTKSKSFFA